MNVRQSALENHSEDVLKSILKCSDRLRDAFYKVSGAKSMSDVFEISNTPESPLKISTDFWDLLRQINNIIARGDFPDYLKDHVDLCKKFSKAAAIELEVVGYDWDRLFPAKTKELELAPIIESIENNRDEIHSFLPIVLQVYSDVRTLLLEGLYPQLAALNAHIRSVKAP